MGSHVVEDVMEELEKMDGWDAMSENDRRVRKEVKEFLARHTIPDEEVRRLTKKYMEKYADVFEYLKNH